ncbi:MAG: response regulator [Thermoguttaceae bacterium]
MRARLAALESAQEVLRQSETLKQTILDSLPEHVAVLDGQGRIVAVNDSWTRFATQNGSPEGVGVGADYLAVCRRSAERADPCADRALAGIGDILAGRRYEFTLDYPCHSPTQQRWYRMHATRPCHGCPGVVVIHFDVTRQIQAEAALKSLNETLEQRVVQRTAELEQRAGQLRRLAAELNHTEQRERRRLAQVLHDHLQQILVAARMKVGQLRRRGAENGNQRIVEEVDHLIDESINESRSLTIELSPPVVYDVGLVAGLEWLARRMEEKHGLPTVVHADASCEPNDEATRLFLFQCVRELLFNVVKHARADSAQIRLARCDDGAIRVEVRDNGIGIAPPRLPSNGRDGGFGLFSVRERLELLGGRMEVDSRPQEGTRISVVVPQARSLPRVPVQGGAELSAAALPRVFHTGGLRVLLADDHPVLRRGLAELLRARPEVEQVFEASDGQEAVERALQTHPDVVLMDVTMPRLTGIEAARRITAALPNVRLIGFSMHEGESTAAAMREAGAVAYLTKGENTEHLMAVILAQPAEDPSL